MAESQKEDYPLLFHKSTKTDKTLLSRHKKAREAAERAAKILKDQFQADKVWIFGSLTQKERFHERSDIDLAASGIPPEKFYKAFGTITRELKDFQIDLVDIDDCKGYLKEAIKREGELIANS
ncbi:MAG: nucleotidyltransferase family protein [Bacillota bacterium]